MLWETLRHSFHTLLDAHALVVIAAVIFIEELGVPSPVPGDLMMLLAGEQVAQGRYPLWLVLLVQEIATLAGAVGLLALSRHWGRPLVARYGKFIHLTPEHLGWAERKVRRYGGWAILVGRLIPGLRIVTPIAAGVLGEPYAAVIPALAVGGFVYLLALTLGGVFFGPTAIALFERVALPISALVSLAVLALLWYAMRRVRAALADEGAIFLGIIAGVAALLLTNSLVGFVRWGYHLAGRVPPLASTGVGTGWRLVLGWPVFLLVAALLGVLDRVLGLQRLRLALRIGLLALVPLLVVLIGVYPLAEGPERHLERGEQVLVVVEVVRWLAFGLSLNALMGLAGDPAEPSGGSPVMSSAVPKQ